ncbi:hypothetical protein TorRG33x02_111000 [Trema orientale]|uniref:Ycf20-like protein n=1 Tax=Trema orientale TaxID=63057 RepID=A0A2P5F5Z3_TREOI|nr:hypothetical protein TorRG33x02_111000 [Trema orientale]
MRVSLFSGVGVGVVAGAWLSSIGDEGLGDGLGTATHSDGIDCAGVGDLFLRDRRQLSLEMVQHSLSLSSTGRIFPFGPRTQARNGDIILRSSPGRLRLRIGIGIRAVQENGGGPGPRRLVDIIRIVPELSRNYFRSPSRRALFGGISLLGGFYVAQTISLSFGALGVNDVIAAVLCVLLTEYVTKFYYSRPKITFPLALLNNFKMGFTYGLFIDAFKLAS